MKEWLAIFVTLGHVGHFTIVLVIHKEGDGCTELFSTLLIHHCCHSTGTG